MRLLAISRDNPNVMKTVWRLLSKEVEDLGNPGLLDLICYLHPTHTSFQKFCSALCELTEEEKEDGVVPVDVSSLIGQLHGWFNSSTARREDLTKIGEEFYDLNDDFEEELSQFFKRHVATRWLEMGPCLKRLLGRWRTTVHYFTVFLPASKDSSDKKAVQTDRFKSIHNALKPSTRETTKAKVKSTLYVCSLTNQYLKVFQSSKPMIHNLSSNSTEMFKSVAQLVLKESDFEKMCSNQSYSEVDFFDTDVLRSPSRCETLKTVISEELETLTVAEQRKLVYDVRFGLQHMSDYLQHHLPLSDPFLLNIGFLHPRARITWNGDTKPSLTAAAVYVAKHMKRFSEEELMGMQVQLGVYQARDEYKAF